MDELAELEQFMRNQPLRFYPPPFAAGMPPMVRLFKRYAPLPPTQDVFIQACMKAATEDVDATRARAARTYPSLVRQQHFIVQLQALGGFDGVHWLPSLDMEHGVDALVLQHGLALGVGVSMQSEEAASWARVKARRHPLLAGLHQVSLILDLDKAPWIGQFAVHPESDVRYIQDEMRALWTQQLPPQSDWPNLFRELKTNHHLRAKASFADAVAMLRAIVGVA